MAGGGIYASDCELTISDSKITGCQVFGPGGAISYAMKYALLKVFNIETGESEESRQEQKPDFINEDQQTEITDLIKETKSDKPKFLKFLGVPSVEKIPQTLYTKAVSALKAKQNGNS